LSESISGIIINDVADHFGIFYFEKHKYKHSNVNINPKRFFLSQNNAITFNQLLVPTDWYGIIVALIVRIIFSAFNLAFPVKILK
jgi:hypothetical protein